MSPFFTGIQHNEHYPVKNQFLSDRLRAAAAGFAEAVRFSFSCCSLGDGVSGRAGDRVRGRAGEGMKGRSYAGQLCLTARAPSHPVSKSPTLQVSHSPNHPFSKPPALFLSVSSLRTLVILMLLFLMQAVPAVAQNQAPPCSAPAYRQFDFWVGEWEVVKPGTDTVVGHNHIKNILNGCVIEENWTGTGGFEGKSFNTYNPVDSTWNQVWVDMGGGTYHFKGRYADHVMMMRGETISPSTGSKVLLEMSYTHDPDAGTVRQVWKTSADEGNSWNMIFDGVYRKMRR